MIRFITFLTAIAPWSSLHGRPVAPQIPAENLSSSLNLLDRLLSLIRGARPENAPAPQPPDPPKFESPYRHPAPHPGPSPSHKASWTWSGDGTCPRYTFQELLALSWDQETLRRQLDQYREEIRDLRIALGQVTDENTRRRFLLALEAVQYNVVQISLPLRAQIAVPRNIGNVTKKAERYQLLSRTDYEAILAEARLLSP